MKSENFDFIEVEAKCSDRLFEGQTVKVKIYGVHEKVADLKRVEKWFKKHPKRVDELVAYTEIAKKCAEEVYQTDMEDLKMDAAERASKALRELFKKAKVPEHIKVSCETPHIGLTSLEKELAEKRREFNENT